nr:DUF1501 domain-containing protein [Pseudomonadales bacterium]
MNLGVNTKMHHPSHHRFVSRRTVLQAGTLGALGWGLNPLGIGGLGQGTSMLLPGAIAAPSSGKHAKACILIWLDGGPSHLEMFYPKPDAPAEVRGPLQTIATAVPSVFLTECLKKTAAMMKDVAIIRSLTSPLGEHNFGTHYMLSGYKPTPVLEYPCFGSVLAHESLERSTQQVLPPHIAVPNFRVGGSDFSGSGFLPGAVRPFSVESDPAKPDFQVKHMRVPNGLTGLNLTRRKQFLKQLNAFYDDSSAPSADGFEGAFQLIGSRESQE